MIINSIVNKKRRVNINEENKEEKIERQLLVEEYNKTSAKDENLRIELMNKMFKSIDEYCVLEPPFHAPWGGKNISIGGAFINYNCVMIDDGNITIGNGVLIGPNVTIITNNHSKDIEERKAGIMYVEDVVIGDNVWIGAGSIILPGVTIGDNSIIGVHSI